MPYPKQLADFKKLPRKPTDLGQSASCRVRDATGHLYQLKDPIVGQSFAKQVRAKLTDRENIAELAAGTLVRAFVSAEDFYLYPEITAYYNHDNPDFYLGQFYIASKYLEGDSGGVRNLDEYVNENLPSNQSVNTKRKHAKFFAGTEIQTEVKAIGLDSAMMKPLRKWICKALVNSAILGDHDINPGNLMVVTLYGRTRVGRIDFGHSFNDLLNTYEIFGGGLREQQSPVKDFINRETIGGPNLLKQGSQSKLWRDYQGLVFTHDMAEALLDAEYITAAQIDRGMQDIVDKLDQLMLEMRQYPENNEPLKRLVASTAAIYANITGKELDPSCDAILMIAEAMGNFVKKNRDDAILTGRLMKMQLKVRELVACGFSNQEIVTEILRDRLDSNTFHSPTLTWIKESEHTKPFVGNGYAFIQHCRKEYVENRRLRRLKAPNLLHLYRVVQEIDTNLQQFIDANTLLTSKNEIANENWIIDKMPEVKDVLTKGDVLTTIHCIMDLQDNLRNRQKNQKFFQCCKTRSEVFLDTILDILSILNQKRSFQQGIRKEKDMGRSVYQKGCSDRYYEGFMTMCGYF